MGDGGQFIVGIPLRYQGNDRWLLEALGIAADGRWNSFLKVWLNDIGANTETDAAKDILWRARSDYSLWYLTKFASDTTLNFSNRLRYLRAIEFNPDSARRSAAFIDVVNATHLSEPAFAGIALLKLKPVIINNNADLFSKLTVCLKATYGSRLYVDLLKHFGIRREGRNLMRLAIDSSAADVGFLAFQLLLKKEGILLLNGKTEEFSNSISRELYQKYASTLKGQELLKPYLGDPKLEQSVKHEIVSLAPKSNNLVSDKHNALNKDGDANKSKHPSIENLASKKGDAKSGKLIFSNYCSACHKVANDGISFGPELTHSGSKFPKEGFYVAILKPDAGISFGFETYKIVLKDATVYTGILVSKTKSLVRIKLPGGLIQEFNTADIASMKEVHGSIMPSLAEAMTTDQLIDLVEYLTTLK